MCLILYAATAKAIKEQWIKNAFRTNDDGYGIVYRAAVGGWAYVKGVEKTPDNILKFLDKYPGDMPIIIHLRYTTAGKSTPEYAHPYPLSGELKRHGHNESLIMHNGTYKNTDHLAWALLSAGYTLKEIDGLIEDFKKKEHSDTYLISLALSKLTDKDSKGRLCRMLTRVDASRLLLLHHDADVPRMYGKWHEEDGDHGQKVWLSNTLYHTGAARSTYTSGYYYQPPAQTNYTAHGYVPATSPHYPKANTASGGWDVHDGDVTHNFKTWTEAYNQAMSILKAKSTSGATSVKSVSKELTSVGKKLGKNIKVDYTNCIIEIEGVDDPSKISIPVTYV